jgi:hypothetical protein
MTGRAELAAASDDGRDGTAFGAERANQCRRGCPVALGTLERSL